VWTLTSGGVIMENGSAVPGGGGTSKLTYVNSNIYGQDSGSGSWYEWAAATGWSGPVSLPGCSSSSGTGVKAVSANDFLNSLGFNIGPGEESSQSEYIAMINYLGVRSMRGATLNGN
jgi:hypothetical protein